MDMVFSRISSILGNGSFLLSFSLTIYYWIKIIFFSNSFQKKYGFWGFFVLNLALTVQLLTRWIESGHFPLSSLYESLLFLCWSISFIYLFLENSIKTEFLGVIVSPLVLFILAFTGFSLPSELQTAKPLVPALQSNWLFMHVSVMMLSYAGLMIGSLISLAYLVIYQLINISPKESTFGFSSKNILTPINLSETENFLNVFDNLGYRIIGIGFCFLTLGILSGAVWANETWGTYWSWDPKETWALITWLTFAVYLHTRLLYGWKGIKPASIASLGFLFVWVCYLGVNLLGKGLHSYGFLS